ncbi:5-formyltetrahydrofolate cyclo-ligase [Solwaraspora sp. WMMD406]|uniref:5-formyltetrahydrofolate cyclo-ligase n=1 Tax=Solwaraspora sp. WMMD406 TaxID=3016095 RepID=UPI002416F32B|nr:5-formyltetrahydrofolate cyclo-ligase [Solwaraspora sp. WMMD406]MDG4768102.1 5-formyltetrahydrofolate cyclo-ligase [Solwaraspora sp. WMMD406]
MSDFPDGANAYSLPKDRLRTAILARRRNLTAADLIAARQCIHAELRKLVRRYAPGLVAGYVPIGREPGGADLPDLLADAVGPAGRILLPVTLPDGDLDWAPYRGAERLRPVGRGLVEPVGDRLGPAVVADAALIVVPALAVDRRGVRLGRGGGSYDRALARARADTPLVALLHDGELLPELPAEAHDRRVTEVITPAGWRPVPAAE